MTTHEQNLQSQAANDHPYQRRVFQVHARVFVASMALVFSVNLALNLATGTAGRWSAWWSLWALVGWGLGVTVHGLTVWLASVAGRIPGSSLYPIESSPRRTQ
jgi:hypothetical protein